MKNFYCGCGQTVFFENTQCTHCGSVLGFDAARLNHLAFNQVEHRLLNAPAIGLYKRCRNGADYEVCNWVLPATDARDYCLACELNDLVPAVTDPKRRLWWAQLENAKKRLIYTLMSLGLPVRARRYEVDGLAFAFLEDRRANPSVEEEWVQTGYAQGLITVNLAEADDGNREMQRTRMGESYRTLLGHFRHESGHYYFEHLVQNSENIDGFRQLFGDESQPYEASLARYYAHPPPSARETGYISDYAQSHPLEDWAECWAHYLHIVDTLETAAEFGLTEREPLAQSTDHWLANWDRVVVVLNALNRSMGMRDAYPFVYSGATSQKIRFVHSVVNPTRMTS